MPTGDTEDLETASVHTEPSYGAEDTEHERARYGDYQIDKNPVAISTYRQWWKSNPLNNLWHPKASMWRRFKAQVEGQTPAAASVSGANLTLDDIKRQAPAPGAYSSGSNPDRDNLPSDEAWFGTPDPDIYAAGTNALDKQQLEEERRKGNVLTLRDVRLAAEKAQGWELEAAQDQLVVDTLQNQVLVKLNDGSVVSLWDLYNYVEHNPELAAIAAKGVNAFDDGSTPEERVQRLPSWQLRPDAPKMLLRPEQEDALPWGLLANGNHWARRPTRWLRGMDAKRNFAYALYAHEDNAQALLGPKWAARAPQAVLGDVQFYRDVAAAGPGMGMTLMAIASRQLPLRQVRDTCVQQLSARVSSAASTSLPSPNSIAAALPASDPTPIDAADAEAQAGTALQQLHAMFEPANLAQHTKLMDVTGEELREGSKLLFTAAPHGSMLVQAVSPGVLREQESYVLGALHSPQVTEAFVSLFANPETSIDPAFSLGAGASLLAIANGFRTKNANRNPNVRTPHDPLPEPVEPGRRPKWALPAAGKAAYTSKPPLLGNVRKRVMAYQVRDAFATAMEAAASVPATPDADPHAVVLARRMAAENALKRAFREMGVDAKHVSIPPPGQEALQDVGALFAMAAPLELGTTGRQ